MDLDFYAACFDGGHLCSRIMEQSGAEYVEITLGLFKKQDMPFGVCCCGCEERREILSRRSDGFDPLEGSARVAVCLFFTARWWGDAARFRSVTACCRRCQTNRGSGFSV